MELYEKIRKIRKARGFSQEELGNRLSKKVSAVNRYLTGKTDILNRD